MRGQACGGGAVEDDRHIAVQLENGGGGLRHHAAADGLAHGVGLVRAVGQQQDAPGVAYSFKYFQQVEGDIVLPPGVKPVRLIVRLVPASGPPVEQSLTWSEATAPAVAAKPAGG